jgi:hypothetical protein
LRLLRAPRRLKRVRSVASVLALLLFHFYFSGCCFAVGRAAHGRVELRRSAALSARAGAVALLLRGRAPLQKRCRVGFAATIAASSGGGDSDPNNEPPTTTPPSPESDDEVRLRLCETARARRVST